MKAVVWFIFSFGAVVLALSALLLFLQSRRRETQDEVLARLQMGEAVDEGESSARLPIATINNPLLRFFYQLISQAGFDVDVGNLRIALIAALIAALLLLWSVGIFLGLFTVFFVLMIAYVYLQNRAGRRNQQVISQLPDFLEHVIRALIAGNTLEEAFAGAAREAQEPVRTLFLGAVRQVRLGAPIEDTLEQLAVVQDLPDVHVLAMAARVNRRYGGSIRNMVKSLIQVIRQRETAASELRALTAETRFSAGILAIIPVGITLFILYRNPGFYTNMWLDPMGRSLLFLGVGLQISGILVILRMMRSVTRS